METTFVQELNYLRIQALMKRTATAAIRIQFNKYFPFHNLSTILHQHAAELETMKRQFIIKTNQWQLLFPSYGKPNSATFDVSLLICLLEYLVFKEGDGRAFTNSINQLALRIPRPVQFKTVGIPGVGWVHHNVLLYKPSDEMPSDEDTGVAADLRRIKLIRKIIDDNKAKKFSNAEFSKLWNDLSSAVTRLGGSQYSAICDNIKDETFANDNDMSYENKGLTSKTKDELKSALLEGTFESYENKIYLAGPCQSGKTSLACILVGNDIPKTWNSTNGLMIYNGQTSIHIRRKTMSPLLVNETVDLQEIALCDIIDFGGQDAFDMLHQLFISQRGTFCFLFDGRKNMSDLLENDNRTIADVLMHWINLILTYCNSQNRGFPKILIVATHRDGIQQNDVEKRRADLVSQIEGIIGLHPLRHHILYDDLAFINTQDKDDREVDNLKKKLVDIAFLQPTWGEKMPKRWRYLQESITKLRLKGKCLMERDEMIQLNDQNAEAALSSKELETFLKVQHALGKVMYFDTVSLRNVIIINPLYMVTLLKSFVTDEQFWPENDELRTIHKVLRDSGILTKVDLFKLWGQQEFEILKSHKEEMASILVDLDVLVEPKDYRKESGGQIMSDFYFVPCVVRKSDSTNYLKEHCTNDSVISLTYRFSSSVIIPAFAFRLFGTCLSMWECKEYKGRKMLFRDSVTVSFDTEHDICISLEASRIHIYLIHNHNRSCIEWNVATSIQECITDALEKILLFYAGTFGGSVRFHQNRSLSLFTFEFKMTCGKKECFAPEFIRNFTPESAWICENKERHDVKWLLMWFPRNTFVDRIDNPQVTGAIEFPTDIHSIPTDREMRRFAIQFTKDDFRNIMVNLEMEVARIEQLFDEHRRLHDGMFYCLWNWKVSEESPTFLSLRNALEKSDLTPDYLLKAIESKTAETCLPTDLENLVPSENLLRNLSRLIGKEVFQLAIELGLEVQDYEDIEYNCNYKNLQDQAHAVLRKWRGNQSKPTIGQLENAMININRDAKILVKLIKT